MPQPMKPEANAVMPNKASPMRCTALRRLVVGAWVTTCSFQGTSPSGLNIYAVTTSIMLLPVGSPYQRIKWLRFPMIPPQGDLYKCKSNSKSIFLYPVNALILRKVWQLFAFNFLVTFDASVNKFDHAVAAIGQARVVRYHNERNIQLCMHSPQ
jgi:hypothetical protein